MLQIITEVYIYILISDFSVYFHKEVNNRPLNYYWFFIFLLCFLVKQYPLSNQGCFLLKIKIHHYTVIPEVFITISIIPFTIISIISPTPYFWVIQLSPTKQPHVGYSKPCSRGKGDILFHG